MQRWRNWKMSSKCFSNPPATRRLFTRWDLLPLGCMMALTLALLLVLFFKNETGRTVTVRVDQAVVWQQPLNRPAQKTVITNYGMNVIEIKDGCCFISNADCRDGVCQKSGKISRRGESIVCLPHRLIVEVE